MVMDDDDGDVSVLAYHECFAAFNFDPNELI